MNPDIARWSPLRVARIAGVLALVSFVAGGLGEYYAPSRLIVPADAIATARNIMASGGLLRAGFAGYLVEALCDIGLTLTLYVLLRPAGKELALLAVLFRVVATSVYAAAELFFVGPSLLLGGADFLKTFSAEQVNALWVLSLKVAATGGVVSMLFYGVGWTILGYLVFASNYLPKLLGALLVLGGFGAAIRSFAQALVPTYASSALLLPMILGGLVLTAWLLVRGLDVAKWQMRAAARG